MCITSKISRCFFDFISSETLTKVEKSDSRGVNPLIFEELNLVLGDLVLNLDCRSIFEGHIVRIEHCCGQVFILFVLFGIKVARDDPLQQRACVDDVVIYGFLSSIDSQFEVCSPEGEVFYVPTLHVGTERYVNLWHFSKKSFTFSLGDVRPAINQFFAIDNFHIDTFVIFVIFLVLRQSPGEPFFVVILVILTLDV